MPTNNLFGLLYTLCHDEIGRLRAIESGRNSEASDRGAAPVIRPTLELLGLMACAFCLGMILAFGV